MIDIRLDPATWDIVIAGDLLLYTQEDECIQHIRQRLQTFQGEWFLNLEAGVPWLQEILGKVQTITTVEVILRDVIQTSPGVAQLLAFSIDDAAGERTITVNFTVELSSGLRTEQSLELTI